MSRLIDADALEPHEQLEPMGNGRYEYVQIVYKDDIDAAPTIEPERKKGRWTSDNSCPFCGFQPWYERDIHTLSYCPDCGSDLREEGEERC